MYGDGLPAVHILHAHNYITLIQECSIKRNDVWGLAFMHNMKLSENLFSNRWLCINVNDLHARSNN